MTRTDIIKVDCVDGLKPADYDIQYSATRKRYIDWREAFETLHELYDADPGTAPKRLTDFCHKDSENNIGNVTQQTAALFLRALYMSRKIAGGDGPPNERYSFWSCHQNPAYSNLLKRFRELNLSGAGLDTSDADKLNMLLTENGDVLPNLALLSVSDNRIRHQGLEALLDDFVVPRKHFSYDCSGNEGLQVGQKGVLHLSNLQYSEVKINTGEGDVEALVQVAGHDGQPLTGPDGRALLFKCKQLASAEQLQDEPGKTEHKVPGSPHQWHPAPQSVPQNKKPRLHEPPESTTADLE